MTIHFTDPTSAANMGPAISSTTDAQSSSAAVAASTAAAPTERVATFDMKHYHESEILSQLLSITKAVPLQPSPEELQQISDLEEQRKQSEMDAQRSQKVNEKRRRRDAMLAQARGEVTASREA